MRMKKHLLVWGLIAAIGMSSIGVGSSTKVYANVDGVAINETNFPDVNFRNYILEEIDTDHDKSLSNGEISNITEMDVSFKKISDLTGIGYFSALTYLSCSNNDLTTLDMSQNTALEELHCLSNDLTSVNVRNNSALKELDCRGNELTSIDVRNNTALIELDCIENSLTQLDVSHNLVLKHLFCGGNKIESIELGNVSTLTSLDCGINKLTSLNVSKNTGLKNFDCEQNGLTQIDVSQNLLLESLRCGSNKLTSLNVYNNTELKELNCGANSINNLDVSNNKKLTMLCCSDNQLTSIDVSNNTLLEVLICGRNYLTSLDVRHNTALDSLYCDLNYFSQVDVTGLDSLSEVGGTIDGNILYVEARAFDTLPATVSKISASDVTVAKGKTKNISAKVSMSDGSKYTGTVTYKSANTKIATVDKNGKVKGVAGGKTTITVSAGGQSTKITVRVADIALESTNFVLQAGKSTDVETILTNDAIKSVKSRNEKIAKVSFKKNVITVKALKKTGTVKIIVTTKQGISKTITVKVQSGKVTTKSIKASTKKVSLAKKGKKATVDITINPISSQDKVKVSVKDSKIAKATYKDGKLTITAKKKGSTKVTVKSGKKSVKITVKVRK